MGGLSPSTQPNVVTIDQLYNIAGGAHFSVKGHIQYPILWPVPEDPELLWREVERRWLHGLLQSQLRIHQLRISA